MRQSSRSIQIVAQRVISLDAIVIGQSNPRQTFGDGDLAELAASIAEFGVLQPVVVTPLVGEGERFELLAGERRVRASSLAGRDQIPALIVVGDPASLRAVQLDENILRVQLNPLEEACGFAGYQRDFPCSLSVLAGRLRHSPDYVRGRLKLLELPQAVQEAVAAGRLALGSAWELLRIEGEQARCVLAETIMQDHLSVAQTAQLVRRRRAELQQFARQARQASASEQYAQELGRRHPIVLTMANYRPDQHRRSPLLVFEACATCPRKAKLVLAPGRVDDVCVDPACYAAQARQQDRERIRRLQERYQARRAALDAVLRTEYVQHEHLQLLMWAMLQALGPFVDSWRGEVGLPAYVGGSYQEWGLLSAWPYERLLTELVSLCVGYIADLPNEVLPHGLRRCLITAFGVEPALLDEPGPGSLAEAPTAHSTPG